MKLTILDEPELEFAGGGRHIDPRFGIAFYGPADANSPTAPKVIRAGLVGTAAAIEGLRAWLERCQREIPGKETHLGHLFPAFPGFDQDMAFRSRLVFEPRLERAIPERAFRSLPTADQSGAVRAAVDLFMAELEPLADDGRCDVILCARPDELVDEATATPTDGQDEDEEETQSEDESDSARFDFHDLLKAKAMKLRVPLQIIRSTTWDPQSASRAAGAGRPARQVQDEATRAWNLHTALYYKAGGVPWRLLRHPSDLTACYVGVSFFRTLDATSLHTAVAQVFNERGDGIIVRGGQAAISKEDRQPHLTEADAHALLKNALRVYRAEHGNFPARIVMHKSSSYSEAEAEGFGAAANEDSLHSLELLWLPRKETARLFRFGDHPPLRGTLLSLDDDHHVLYTRGGVDFFKVYPGMYVPHPLGIRLISVERSGRQLASEMLSLTKMNWNQAQFDGREPVTLRTSYRVGKILKYVGQDDSVAPRYAYYM